MPKALPAVRLDCSFTFPSEEDAGRYDARIMVWDDEEEESKVLGSLTFYHAAIRYV